MSNLTGGPAAIFCSCCLLSGFCSGLTQQVVDVGRAVLVLDQRGFQAAYRHLVHHHLFAQQRHQCERDTRGFDRCKFLVIPELGKRHLAQACADVRDRTTV